MDSLDELNSSDEDELKMQLDDVFMLHSDEIKKNRGNLEIKNIFVDDNLNDVEDENERERDLEILENLKKDIKINNLFEYNECQYSLFWFSQNGKFRKFFMRLIHHNAFLNTVTVLIYLSSFRLILETYYNDLDEINYYFDILDTVINICFLLELICKIIAKGFVMDKGTYLQDNWNKLDFFIVVTSFYSFSSFSKDYIGNQLDTLRVFKIFRILRPIRIIAKNSQMKLIITSLSDSIQPIFSVFMLTFLMMIIFCIVCISFIYNLYHTCYQPNYQFVESGNIFWVPIRNFSEYIIAYNITADSPEAVSDFVIILL